MIANIDCRQIRQLLSSDYLDNELAASAREQIDRHLEQCPECRRISANLAAIAQPLRRTRRQAVPPEIWSRVKAELRRQPAYAPSPKSALRVKIIEFFLMRPPFAAAAAAAVLLLVSAAFLIQTLRVDSAEHAPDLGALTGNLEIHAPLAGFGSNIEQLFL